MPSRVDNHPSWWRGSSGGFIFNMDVDGERRLNGLLMHGDELGVPNTPCGGTYQLPLSERPSDPLCDATPTPAAALAVIDGHHFTVDWGGGYTAELVARVRSISETACWSVLGPRFGTKMSLRGEVELVDASDTRVAATPVMVGAQPCSDPSGVGGCVAFRVQGSGEVRTVEPDEPLPDLSFDDGGALVARPAFGVTDLTKLMGGTATGGEAWVGGGYTIEVRNENGQLSAPSLEIYLAQDETQMLVGRSAQPSNAP